MKTRSFGPPVLKKGGSDERERSEFPQYQRLCAGGVTSQTDRWLYAGVILPDAAKEGLKLADLSAIIASQAARARTKGGPSGASHKKGGGQQGYMLGGPGEVGGLPGLPKLEMDLPIDPNEPTYCFCNRVSFGEMIACDNEQCKVSYTSLAVTCRPVCVLHSTSTVCASYHYPELTRQPVSS